MMRHRRLLVAAGRLVVPALFTWMLVLLAVPAFAQTEATVLLRWAAPQAGTVVGYIMERKRGAVDTWGPLLRRTAELTYTDTVPTDTWPVCYRVKAYAGSTQSEPSNELCLAPPDAPQRLEGTFEGTMRESPEGRRIEGTFQSAPLR